MSSIDFSAMRASLLSLINDAPAPYTMGGQFLAEEVMLFKGD